MTVGTNGGHFRPRVDATPQGRQIVGDEAALAAAYKGHSSTVYSVALRVTRNRSAAEDVTQAVFLDLWHRPQRFDPARGSFRSWLATVAHHRSVDWVREDLARRARERRDFESPVVPSPDVEEAVAATLTAERVRRALAVLNENERTAICLAYFGGHTYRQVAADLGIAEGTIKSRIRSGLARLAQEIDLETD